MLKVPRPTRPHVLAGVLALLAASSACTAGSSTSAGGGGADETLIVDTSFVIKNLDPGRVYEGTGNMTVHALYDTLMTFEGSDVSDPKPLLAESFEASPNARTFTFTLRNDATFSDGSPVTAEDVVFSLNRLKNLKDSPTVMVQDLSFEKGADGTVVVTSKTPNPDVPTILAMPPTGIMNSEVVRKHGGTAGEDAATADSATSYLDKESAGAGPYVLESFDSTSRIVLEANPDYWGERPGFSRVVIRNMDVQTQKLTMSKASGSEVALDLSGKLLEGLPASLRQSGVQDTFYMVFLNQDPAVSQVTSNDTFVRALRASIDYEGVAALFGTNADPAAGVVPPAFHGALPASEAPEQDLDRARQLLEESGITDPTVRFIYPEITYRGVDLGTIATKVAGDAKKAGIELELTPQPLTTFLEEQRDGKAEMVFTPQSLNYPVAASLVNNMAPGKSTALRAGWTAERADPAVKKASKAVLAATDPDARAQAMQEWQRAMNRYSPFIALATNSGVVVATPSLTDAVYSPAGWLLDVAAVGQE